VAGWPAVVKRELTAGQYEELAGIWRRYVGYKDVYLAEAWTSPGRLPG
jgi:hypothetical protein